MLDINYLNQNNYYVYNRIRTSSIYFHANDFAIVFCDGHLLKVFSNAKFIYVTFVECNFLQNSCKGSKYIVATYMLLNGFTCANFIWIWGIFNPYCIQMLSQIVHR